MEEMERQQRAALQRQKMQLQHEQISALANDQEAPAQQAPLVREGRKVGRNDPCPCGSGKKYKQCHGQLE